MGKFNILFRIDLVIQNLYGKIITVIRRVLKQSSKKLLKRNKALVKDCNSKKRCYVIGLGPSLKKVDYKHLPSGDSIVVNRFHEYDNGEFDPTYYMISDGAFFKEPLINELKIMYELYPNAKFILDGLYYKNIKKALPDEQRIYYCFSGNGVYNRNKRINYSKWESIKYNVIAGAIATAIYMEYKEIVLLGCDFNSFAYPKAVHCYEEKNSSRKISLSFELFCYSFAAYVHEELARYASSKGIKILNATEGSLIDAYEKVDIESVFNHHDFQ